MSAMSRQIPVQRLNSIELSTKRVMTAFVETALGLSSHLDPLFIMTARLWHALRSNEDGGKDE